MASRKLEDLIPEVKEKVIRVVGACDEVGIDILIYCTLRPLEEQARLYRQSRSSREIRVKVAKFRDRGFGFLADIIEKVGPCHGKHVTNAAPGESWHGYGEAVDGVPLIGGKAAWKYMDAPGEWEAYGEALRQVGMQWAGDWKRFKERPHGQLRDGSNPLKRYSPDEIRKMLVSHNLI